KSAGQETPSPGGERASFETIVDDFLHTDRVGIEIGARLIPLARSEQPGAASGNVLVERVTSLRRDLAKKNGVWVPSIRIRDNMQLEPSSYRIFINSRQVATGSIRVGSYLAIVSGDPLFTLEGEATQEPAFGL